MTEDPVVFRDVRKTFRLRNRSDSLRDAIPRVLRRALGRGGEAPAPFVALDGASFAARKGEVLGLVGANGAGKSTALRLAAGVYRADGGTVSVRGRVAAMIELGAGFHPDLSGRENIFLAGALLGLRKREVQAVLEPIVEFSGVGGFIDSPVRVYSSGMAVRLGFSVAAHVPAEVLLVDEVLAVGDLEFQERCLRRMEERRAEGVTVLFVSHNMAVVEQFCDRVVLLHHGKVVADGPPREAVAEYRRVLAREMTERGSDPAGPAASRPRHGTGALLLEKVRISGEPGGGAGSVPAGGRLVIRVDWRAPRPCADPVLGCAIYTQDGALCAEATNAVEPAGALGGSGSFEVVIPALPLLPGDYEVSVFAKDSDGLMPLDMHHRLYPLKVLGRVPSGERGLVSLASRWTYAGGGGAEG